MKSLLQHKYAAPVFILASVLFIGYIWYAMFRIDGRENEEICKMKAMALKGVIVGKSGNNSYHYIEVDNVEGPLRVSIAETKYYKGFNADYNYTVGDSIIKEAGSAEFTIKKGGNMAVHIIACN